MTAMHNPVHPGEVLQDWLEGMSVTEVARHLGVSRVGLSRVLHGQTGISPEMSIKLSEALGTSPDLWFKMQANYDFWTASRKKRKKVAKLKLSESAKEQKYADKQKRYKQDINGQ